jgi:hypothetical protein
MTLPTPSFEDLYQIGLTELVIRRPDLEVREGDVTDAMLCAIAAAGDLSVGVAVAGVKRTFFDGANGTDLTRLIDDHTGVPRVEITSAIGQVTLSRATAAYGAFTYPVNSRVAAPPTADGKQVIVKLDANASFGALDLSVVAAVTAVTAGPDGNAAAGTITTFLDTPLDVTLTVTNAQRIAGGAPAESDEDYRRRGRDFYVTLRRATLAALEYAALTVPAVRSAIAEEDAQGLVTLYVSDAAGNSNLEMIADVVAALAPYRAGGITVQVVGSAVLTVNVDYSLVVATGVSASDLEPAIDTSMTARGAKQRSGQVLYLEELRFAAKSVDPDGIRNVVINSPAVDTTPNANQVIRIGTVTRS